MARKVRTSAAQPVMMAVEHTEKLLPAFTVRKIEDSMPHKVHIFDKTNNRIKTKTVMEPGGYLVSFRKGHSIRVRNDEQLKQIGANLRLVPLMDDEGVTKGFIQNTVALDDDDDDRELQMDIEETGE